jgi:organic hydroperoxide reductase OsmC/OhrA
MLWYLHLCATGGVEVFAYDDDASGTMEEAGETGGRFIEVTLRPTVTVADASQVRKARDLHAPAHEKCFIANSVNFPVRHEATVVAAGEPD